MIELLLLVLLIFVLAQNSSQNNSEEVSILGYKTKYFHISDGASKRMFENMKKDRLSPESLLKFLHMEDRFLKLEHMSACSGGVLRVRFFIPRYTFKTNGRTS